MRFDQIVRSETGKQFKITISLKLGIGIAAFFYFWLLI